jgi:hypothetical protein
MNKPVNGMKLCGRCGEVKPVALFPVKRKLTAAGSVCHYAGSVCKACAADWQRDYLRAKAGLEPAPRREVKVVELWPREPEQAECDTAFMGWRMTNPGTNLPTLSWRV